MKDSYIQTNSSSPRDPIFAEDNPGHNSRYLQCATARNPRDDVLHRATDDEIHAEEFNIVSSTFNLARDRR